MLCYVMVVMLASNPMHKPCHVIKPKHAATQQARQGQHFATQRLRTQTKSDVPVFTAAF
jgi:hypothetical protein